MRGRGRGRRAREKERPGGRLANTKRGGTSWDYRIGTRPARGAESCWSIATAPRSARAPRSSSTTRRVFRSGRRRTSAAGRASSRSWTPPPQAISSESPYGARTSSTPRASDPLHISQDEEERLYRHYGITFSREDSDSLLPLDGPADAGPLDAGPADAGPVTLVPSLRRPLRRARRACRERCRPARHGAGSVGADLVHLARHSREHPDPAQRTPRPAHGARRRSRRRAGRDRGSRLLVAPAASGPPDPHGVACSACARRLARVGDEEGPGHDVRRAAPADRSSAVGRRGRAGGSTGTGRCRSSRGAGSRGGSASDSPGSCRPRRQAADGRRIEARRRHDRWSAPA